MNIKERRIYKTIWARENRRKNPGFYRTEYLKYRDKNLAYKRADRIKRPEHYRAKARENYWNNLVKEKEYRKKWHAKTRQEAIDAYGGKCKCCDESRKEFLAFDHINGGGSSIRRETGIKGGASFCIWLRRNNWPNNIRILCHNCNSSIGYYHYCPHQKNQLHRKKGI